MFMHHSHTRRRLSALIFAGILAMLSTGCSNNAAQDSGSADSAIFSDLEFSNMESLEYGATMRDNTDYSIPVEYDKRFLEDGEVEALVNYFTSIQTEDAQLYDDCTPDFYVDYYLENVYGGLLDSDAYLAQQYRTFQDQLDGADVTFSLLSVTSCTEDESAEDGGIAALKEMCVELEGQEYCDANWNGCKLLTVEPTLSDGTDNTLVGGSMNIFVVQLEGSYYICA